MAHVVLQPVRLDARVARVAERATRVLDEACVGEFGAALLASEARRVPIGVHRLYHATDHKLAWK